MLRSPFGQCAGEHWSIDTTEAECSVLPIASYKKQKTLGRWKALQKNVCGGKNWAKIFVSKLRALAAERQAYEDEDEYWEMYKAKVEATATAIGEVWNKEIHSRTQSEAPSSGPFGPEGIYRSEFTFNNIPCAEGSLFPDLAPVSGRDPRFNKDALVREIAALLQSHGGQWRPWADSKWSICKVISTQRHLPIVARMQTQHRLESTAVTPGCARLTMRVDTQVDLENTSKTQTQVELCFDGDKWWDKNPTIKLSTKRCLCV